MNILSVVYLCMSQRKGCGVAWRLRQVDYILLISFAVRQGFALAMMDGDKAQLYACVEVLPRRLAHVLVPCVSERLSKAKNRKGPTKNKGDFYSSLL